MTLPIKQMGGLLEGEIRLLIEDSADRRDAALDTKLSAHRDDLNKRLERTEDVVNSNNERLADLQANVAVISDANARQTALLEKMDSQSETWHTDDLTFRAEVATRFGKIETDQIALTTQVKRLRWVGWAFFGLGKSCKFVYSKLCEIGVWKVIFLAILLWILKILSPVLYQLAMQTIGH